MREIKIIDIAWDGATYGIFLFSGITGLANYRALLGVEWSDVAGFRIHILFMEFSGWLVVSIALAAALLFSCTSAPDSHFPAGQEYRRLSPEQLDSLWMECVRRSGGR